MSENIKNINETEAEAPEVTLPEKVEIVGVNFREAGKYIIFLPENLN